MAKRDRSDEDLQAAVQSPGFRPARAELEPLLAKLAGADEDAAEAAERALARLGMEAARAAIARLTPTGARPPERGRLCRLIGRVAQATRARELCDRLLEALSDEDPKTRRNAIIALGKIGGDGVEAALLDAWPREGAPERRSIAAALGKMGGPSALALLDGVTTDDAELRRIADEARLKLRRTLGRSDGGSIDLERAPSQPLTVWLHCRDGLTELVTEELGKRLTPRALHPRLVEARLGRGEKLSALYRSRTMLRFGFPLPVAAGEVEPAVVGALASEKAAAIVRAFTVGPARYRIEWSSGGHRRGLTYRVARAVAALRPELVNDPTESLWEAVVTEGQRVTVELWPRGVEDPRFAYRQEHLPASSHPTLAAALARVAGARADDVVWDPFVGAGTELVERAKLGAYRRLIGTDVDAGALERAGRNLKAAGVEAELAAADARLHHPPGVTLIVTNPPMGRRVLNKQLTGALYDAFLENAARVLAPGGRLVWISPRAVATVDKARLVGFRSTYRQRIDMGGFWAELQSFERRTR